MRCEPFTVCEFLANRFELIVTHLEAPRVESRTLDYRGEPVLCRAAAFTRDELQSFSAVLCLVDAVEAQSGKVYPSGALASSRSSFIEITLNPDYFVRRDLDARTKRVSRATWQRFR